jgi:hypothetical protein
MATIVEQGKLIIQHPFFEECLDKANRGDMSGFERLFLELTAHCWEKCSLASSRTYGTWHRANHMLIKKELRDMPPPTNLNLRLPFVKPKQESSIHAFKTTHRHIRVQVHNPNQLLFTFTVENI